MASFLRVVVEVGMGKGVDVSAQVLKLVDLIQTAITLEF